jgi:hypothetical protein
MATPFQLHRLIAICTICFIFLPCQAQDILWEKSLGGKHAEYLTDAVATADYGFMLAGSSFSSKTGNKTSVNEGDLDYWIWKMDEKGEMEWQKSFGGSGTDFLQSIKLTIDGGFILAGNSDSPKGRQKTADCNGESDFWIIKLDAGGGEQWQKTIGGTADEKLKCISQTKDGGYLLGGSSSSDLSGDKDDNGFGSMDYWIVKLDKDGKIEWQSTLGGKYLDELRSVEQTRDNGYILGGYSNSPQSGNKTLDNFGDGDFWILKLDRHGKTEWEKVIGGTQDEQLYTVHQTYDGGFIIGGNSNSIVSGTKTKGNGKGTDFWIVKIDLDGVIIWQETYDFGSYDVLTSIVENKDHTFLVGGFAKSEQETKKDDKGINDYIAMKISEKGDMIWNRFIGSNGDDALRKVIETRDGGYILAGTSNPMRSMKTKKSNQSKTKQAPIKLGNRKPNKQVQQTTDAINESIKETTDSLNEEYNKAVGGVTDQFNKTVDTGKDSPFKVGVNAPQNPLGSGPKLGSGTGSGDALSNLMDDISNRQTTLPASGEKSVNYGNRDFWIVKLKDKMKPISERTKSLEASPNPTSSYTNVIVNYDYTDGTASVVDMSGHILDQFSISGQTVPVNLSGYPEGMYIINIKTNVQSDGVKVMKRGN